jgi:hypothetical protein
MRQSRAIRLNEDVANLSISDRHEYRRSRRPVDGHHNGRLTIQNPDVG